MAYLPDPSDREPGIQHLHDMLDLGNPKNASDVTQLLFLYKAHNGSVFHTQEFYERIQKRLGRNEAWIILALEYLIKKGTLI